MPYKNKDNSHDTKNNKKNSNNSKNDNSSPGAAKSLRSDDDVLGVLNGHDPQLPKDYSALTFFLTNPKARSKPQSPRL